MSVLSKLFLGFNALQGYVYKFLVDIHLINVPSLSQVPNNDVVISLTSYGRRVRTGVVYYTLVSLLRQKVQPAHIVLWLAEDEWNDKNIPRKLQLIRRKGVEICFCKDMKSYKKLIPAIEKYSNFNIITVDDDVIYSKDTVSSMLSVHRDYPQDIICTVARIPLIVDGLPRDYQKWQDSLIKKFKPGENGLLLFPVGVGGVLYPKGSLHEDVVNEGIFMKFCPFADDVWFWFCGLRNKTIKRYIVKKGIDVSFDSLYQYFHKGTALTHTNNFQHQNDKQISDLFGYYAFKIN